MKQVLGVIIFSALSMSIAMPSFVRAENPPAMGSTLPQVSSPSSAASIPPGDSPATGQTDNLESLENMFLTQLPKVTIASAKAEDPDKAPADVFVITGEEMVQRGYRSLVDLIQDLPGVTIDQDVSDQGGSITVRGIQSNQMFRLMINGMPINPAAGNSIPWDERFSIAEIERVEFILGPYPALYGRNTFSGIMNVVTKTGEQLKGGEVKALYGSWNKTQGTAVFGDKAGGFDVLLSLFKNVSSSGRDLAQEYPEIYSRGAREGQANPVVDTPFALSFDNLSPDWTMPWDATDIYFRLLHDSGLFVDFSWNRFICAKMGNYYSPLVYLQNPDGKTNENIINGCLGYKFHLGDSLESTTSLGVQRFDWNCNNLYNFAYDADGNQIDNVRGEKYYAVASTEYSLTERTRVKLWEQNELYAGIVWDTIFLDPYKTSNDGMVSTTAVLPTWGADEVQRLTYLNVSLQDEMQFTDYLKAVAGVMYEKSNTYADVFMPRFSVVLDPLASTTVKAIYSEGYITPDPLDAVDQYLGASSTKGVTGIRPEAMDSFDLTVIQRVGKNIRLTGSAFYNRIKDMVQTVTDNNLPAPFTQTYKNMGQTIAKGFEFSGDFGITSNVKLTAGYGFVQGQADSVDPDGNIITNNYLAGAVIHHLKVGANVLLWDRLRLFVHDLLIGNRWTDMGDVTPGYNLIDIALTTTPQFDKHWSISGRVKNVLDQKGFDAGFTGDFVTTDLAIARRTWDVEVGYRF
jgi:iron complex outermembrane receptor protein